MDSIARNVGGTAQCTADVGRRKAGLSEYWPRHLVVKDN